MGFLALVLFVVRCRMDASTVIDVDVDVVMDEAYVHVEVLAEIQEDVVLLCTHRMETEEGGPNKILLHRDVPSVAVAVDVNANVHCYKEMANASTHWAADQEAHGMVEVAPGPAAVGSHHIRKTRAEVVRDCYCMDLDLDFLDEATSLRSRKDTELKNCDCDCDVNLSSHPHVDELDWMQMVEEPWLYVICYMLYYCLCKYLIPNTKYQIPNTELLYRDPVRFDDSMFRFDSVFTF